MHNNNFWNMTIWPLTIIMAAVVVIKAAAAEYEYKEFFHIRTGTNVIVSMTQGPDGVLWLGSTKGLMRLEDLNNPQLYHALYPTEIQKAILSVAGTDDGRLWITMLSNKKYIYTPSVRKLEELDNDWIKEMGLKSDGWWNMHLVVTDSRDVWFVEGKYVYHMNIFGRGKPALVATLPEPATRVYSDKYNCHIATDRHIYTFRNDGRIVRKVCGNNPLDRQTLRTIVQDKKGNLWGGNNNLYRYDRKNGTWEKINENIFVTSMTLSRNNEIFAGTNNGLMCYGHDGRLKYVLGHNPYLYNGIESNHVCALYMDREENMLVSYNKGDLSVSSLRNNVIVTSHIEDLRNRNTKDDIISMACGDGNTLLLGTDGHGLYEVDTATGRTVSSKLRDIAGDNQAVTALFVDSRHRQWIGRYLNGAIRIDPDGSTKELLHGSSPYSFEEDENGNVYIGLSGNGLFRISDSSGLEKINLSDCKYMQQLECNKTGSLYVAMSDGLIRLDTRTNKYYNISDRNFRRQQLNNRNITSVLTDSRNLLWVIESGENQTLEVIDFANDTIMTIPQLQFVNVQSIIEDNNNSMWIASETDIHNVIVDYDIHTRTYRLRCHTFHFRQTGEQTNYHNPRAVAKLSDGNIVFGGVNGYRIINPAALSDVAMHTDIAGRLTSIRINNKYVLPGQEYDGNVILRKDIGLTDRIELEASQNNIGITFFPRDYASPLNTDYYYTIDDKQLNWSPLKDNMVELANLAPGNYDLRIRGKKTDGTLSEDVAHLKITVKSPWYLTPWAYVVYVIAGCLLFLLVTRYLIDRQKQKLRILQAEKEIERQYQTNEMKLRFFTNISHDFRTPLSLIITPLETYLADHDSDKDKRFLEPVYKNAVRLLNLVNQVLDFRKLETYGVSLNLSYGDFVGFIRDVCSSFTLFSEEKCIHFSFESDVKALNMYFDKDKITKIMMNLLSNAIKFTGIEGEVTVKISLANDGGCVSVTVADTGIGISDDDKTKIFDRFFQSKSENHSYIGTGIGLHIVKEFVELHKGTVTVRDNYPKGTLLGFELPVIKELPDTRMIDASTNDVKSSGLTIPTDANGRDTILLVEDNVEFIDFLANALSDHYNVVKATNGKEALHVLKNESIQIIISDVMMDEMDGFELCRAVKTDIDTSHIPFILLTAKALAEDELKGLELGADDYITKPFNMSVLGHKIARLLDDSARFRAKFHNLQEVKPSEITITSLDEKFLSNAIRIVEENISDPDFSVETLSHQLGVHRTQLYKKLLYITGKSPIEFIRFIRLKRAAQYLGKSQMYVSEIAYKVGFNTPRLFTRYFKEEFGMTPREYIRDYENKANS